MAVLGIEKGASNKILRTKSLEVKKIDKKIKKLISDMTDTVFSADGLGIAAPQVGKNLRIFIARLNFRTKQEMILPVINPEIVNISSEMEVGEEGCLSLPKKFGVVLRPKELIVRYLDQKGKICTLQLSGMNSRIIQHEIDHINAILFIDKMEREVTSGKAAL